MDIPEFTSTHPNGIKITGKPIPYNPKNFYQSDNQVLLTDEEQKKRAIVKETRGRFSYGNTFDSLE